MEDFATAARRLAISIEQLMQGFFSNNTACFRQALSDLQSDLPIVSGSMEPLGLEHANLLRERVRFIVKRTSEAFDRTRIISECNKNGPYFEYRQLTRNHIETELRTIAGEAVAALRSWAVKVDAEDASGNPIERLNVVLDNPAKPADAPRSATKAKRSTGAW